MAMFIRYTKEDGIIKILSNLVQYLH
uniref:Uncharacterized protein n=1 Tax=Lepeophtheirus salmonis TaxID=72036 RepID=A0A0K2UFD0_LEPSM